MAHVEKRGAGRWVAIWKDPSTGKRRAQSFPRKLDADRFLAATTVDVLRGSWVDPRAGNITLGTYARQWVTERAIKPTTRASYRTCLNHLGPLAAQPVGALKPSTMRTWQAGLSARLAPSTVVLFRSIVAAILQTAVTDRLITASPLDGVPVPAAPTPPVRPYELARVAALRDAFEPRLAAAIILGAGTGLRRGEAMGLTVDRVDWLRHTITVDRQYVGGSGLFGPLKTAASYRTVPAPQIVLDALAAHLAAHPASPAGLIFTGHRGAGITSTAMGRLWLDAEIRMWVGLPGTARVTAGQREAWRAAHPAGHGGRYHHLRHFYASTLIRAGESVKVVQARLGHASAVETLATYAHLFPDDDARTRAAIDAALTLPGSSRKNFA